MLELMHETHRSGTFTFQVIRPSLNLRASEISVLTVELKLVIPPYFPFSGDTAPGSSYGSMANERTGKPDAFLGLATMLKMIAPRTGTWSKLAKSSI
ncbi:hypothetical protein MEG1DRAFT_01798 [Photorhabdus temperata subsp. temperata Meg1]|uniref:Uncharacterized protein n=1 Tax=Photorhabdus temperata subsp. temperata Meg1 TaxID=1393735 RepID=A0A081RXX6_PHOTE|nr:hypothetical protein MEG1DRAFT_01798 [Photorhabdus temperata subsp. temperata Meg1]